MNFYVKMAAAYSEILVWWQIPFTNR